MGWEPNPTGILKQAFKEAYKTMGPGLCLEFGVGMGNSYVWQALQMKSWAKGCHLIGFDSFEGLPEETEGVWAPERHGKGCFSYAYNVLEEHMLLSGLSMDMSDFDVEEGFFEETLRPELQRALMEQKLMFVNIDVDIYKSTIQALDFIRPMIRVGQVIYFDDWLDPIDIGKGAEKWGEHLAWEQWSAANGVEAVLGETNNLNQRYLVVTEC